MNERWCRNLIKDRSEGLCERCGTTATDLHHRRNRSAGGNWDPRNIVHLCRTCHHWVTVNPVEASWEGLHLAIWENFDTPLLRCNEWVLLYDDGSYGRYIPDAGPDDDPHPSNTETGVPV